ncbi:MAG: hypothetical protein QOG82_2683 [Actinomycetota bacterium]|jgi:DNA-binding NarL/FixJ family response regulator|nr:hypothetical protein [Actinomycetota bacterium]
MTVRVVLADDEPLVRSGVAMLLTADPEIEVVAEVGDGRAAVEAVERLRPDVALLDVRMPEMDGVEATRLITTNPGFRATTVLILTTYNLDEAVYSALCAGAAGFLLKDAMPAELISAIKALAAGEGWLDPGVTRSLIREFAARAGGVAQPGTGSPEAMLRRDGEFWTVGFRGQVHFLKDSVGLLYLARLLRQPGQEMHVLDLVGPPVVHGSTARAALDAGLSTAPAYGIALLDDTARRQYRQRITDLRIELEEAEEWCDLARADRARLELDQVVEELARRTGLGGRDRETASAVERARVSVTKAIKATIRRLDKQDPVLARHLDLAVRTGSFCCYDPEDPDGVTWAL